MAKTITDLARNEMYVVGDLLDLYSVPAAFTGGGKTHPCDRSTHSRGPLPGTG